MGLHSPFGYLSYEVTFANLLIHILDKLCSHCHTDEDYQGGCKSCPAGNLVFECRDYILTAHESDKRFELYASEEWAKKTVTKTNPATQAKDKEMAQAYKPECDILRVMKQKVKRITPHPFFYVRGRKGVYRRPNVLADFVKLTEGYEQLSESRLRKARL